MGIASRLRSVAGLDRNVGWTMAARLLTMVAGFVAIVPIAHFLSPEQQGYYFTFASITALQALFELGLTQILVQIASHEFAFLPAEMTVEAAHGDRHGRKLAHLAQFANGWYAAISAGFTIVVSTVGLVYFAVLGTLPAHVWALPWLLLVALVGLNLFLSPRLAFVEGAGHPGSVAALRLWASLAGYALLIVLLLAGAGLWSVVAVPAAQTLFSLEWLARRQPCLDFFAPGALRPRIDEPEWRRDIFGLQWRVALSWVGGYLSGLVFTPLLFAAQGPAAAGRWGVTYSLFTQVSGLGMSWATAGLPRYGRLIALGQRRELDRDFMHATVRSAVFVAMASIGIIGAIAVATPFGFHLIGRLLDLPAVALLALVAVANTVVFCLASYMRAHKEEPLVTSSLVIGATTVVLAAITARMGTTATAATFAAVTLGLNLPWRWLMFRSYVRNHGG